MNARNDPEIYSLLARLPLCSALTPDQLEHLANGSRMLEFDRGEMVCERDSIMEGFYCVASGQVKLYLLSPHGDEKVVDIIDSYQSFGEAAIFLKKTCPVYVQTLLPSRLLLVSGSAVLDAVDNWPGFARHMLAGMSARLHQFINDLESYCLMNSTQRVVGFLYAEIQSANAGGETPFEYRLPFSKALLASRLNLTPETLSRVLHSLVEDGAIEMQGKNIIINDLDRLTACSV